MTDEEFNSPLCHLHTEFERLSGEAVTIREAPFLTQISVRVPPESTAFDMVGAALGTGLPLQPNTVARIDELRVLWLGPDEWLVIAPPGEQHRLVKLLRYAIGDEFGSVTDVSAQRTTLMLTGPEVSEVLATGCTLDLDSRIFTGNHCAQTMLAKAPVILRRHTNGFAIAVRASFADYLARWLLGAITGHETHQPSSSLEYVSAEHPRDPNSVALRSGS